MNGRVYDPLVGRFISPDPFVQMPDYSQSYNRYSYAFNNPLRFSDPSGFFAEGDSTIRPTAELPFLPAKTKPSYRPKASTNTDNTSLGSGVKESETTLPIPYLQSKLSNDAEENADKKSEKNVQEGMSVNPARAYWHYKFGNGNDYHVDISQVDWTMLSAKNFPDGVGSTRQINIFNIKPLSTAGLVFGDIRLQYLGNNHFKVADVFGYGALAGQPYFDTYNFNVRWGEVLNGQNLSRNINTGIGWIGVNMPWHPLLFNTYVGNHYKFIFHGTGIIGGGQ